MNKLDRKRAIKLRVRRSLRLQRRQVEELSALSQQRLEDDFFKRLERLGVVRRFVVAWVTALVLLIGTVVTQTRALSGYYQDLGPAPGGTYTEGIVGAFTNANPVYATDLVDTSVSRLLFSSLLKYDQNNQLEGDLAERWETDARGLNYVFHLRPNLKWHDGRPLTSADVLFTYQIIQNPDAHSPLFGSFRGITVAAPDARTVTFALPSPLASFPYSLTNGIVPKHILGSTPMLDMRSVSFNSTRPIGSGPFMWQALELSGGSADAREERIGLKAYDNYHFGKPKLNSFVVRTYRDPAQLIKSYQRQEVFAASGLSSVPEALQKDGSMHAYHLPLTAAVMTFFRTQDGVLADSKVRQALVRAADTASIIDSLEYATQPVRQPLLHGQLGYNPAYHQASYDPTGAKSILDSAGWLEGKGGVRAKGGQLLTFTLYYLEGGEYESVAKQLVNQWKKIGVDAKLTPQTETEFQTVLANAPSSAYHSYDALLYGISIGVDPDVYIYWDSSQIDLRSTTRLNFSQYSSKIADESLESGRTRLDPALRTAKYQPFLSAWQTDAPALGLYQPRFLYITHGQVYGLEEKAINSDAQRYSNVDEWQIRETRK
ncbi:MAG TPA: ABC transporter substrate-binding protein [Candidatus Saccharimonadales bacterium]|nr:ABC transporter substrate-binding protein [Candidatus Saccharimonadales bacterium]